MSTFNNKVALVTGGNSGIGYATAKALKAAGASVIVTGSNAANTEKAAQELAATGIVADISKLADIDTLVKTTVEKHGNIDYLFINAGIAQFAPVEALSEEHFDSIMDINFKGAAFTLQKAIPYLNSNASVVFLSTTMVGLTMVNSAIYTASKAAMNALAKIAAVELAPKGIRVNIVSPGTVTTPIYSKLGFPEEALNGFQQAMIGRTPLARFGEVDEIAVSVLHLFSDNAKYITGAELVIDGGIALNKVI
jgi:NAD(P)-dependent dehydrogenase (short-subunit alcohol dehydrogenase family)